MAIVAGSLVVALIAILLWHIGSSPRRQAIEAGGDFEPIPAVDEELARLPEIDSSTKQCERYDLLKKRIETDFYPMNSKQKTTYLHRVARLDDLISATRKDATRRAAVAHHLRSMEDKNPQLLEFINRLESDSREQRRALGYGGWLDSASPWLALAIITGNSEIQEWIAQELNDRFIPDLGRKITDPIPAIERLLDDHRYSVRLVGIRILATLGSTGSGDPAQMSIAIAAIEKLRGALNNPELRVRVAAASAIWTHPLSNESQVQAGIEQLRNLLREGPPEIRIAAAKALWQVDRTKAAEIASALSESLRTGLLDPTAVRLLREIGPSSAVAVPVLIDILKNHDTPINILREVITTLGALGDSRATPFLIENIKPKNSDRRYLLIREELVRALGALRAHDAVPSIIMVMEEGDIIGFGPSTAATTLGELGGAGAIEALIKALQKGGMLIRLKAAQALGAIGPAASPAVPMLEESLKNDQLEIRIAAAKSLGQIGPKANQVIPSLLLAMKEKDMQLRMNAAEAAGKIERTQLPAAVSVLLDVLGSGSPAIRVEAGKALILLDTRQTEVALAAIKKILRDSKPKDLNPVLHAVEFLGEPNLSHSASIPLLIEVLSSHSEILVQTYAAQALGRIGPQAKDAVPQLVAALQDTRKSMYTIHLPVEAARALGNIGPAAKDSLAPLASAQSKRNAELRTVIAEAMARINR